MVKLSFKMTPYFPSAAEYCIFSFAILMFDRTGGSNIFGGATAGVVRTSTGGSPSSPFPIFSQEKGENFPDKNHGGAARLW